MITVVGVDPGKSTGLALIRVQRRPSGPSFSPLHRGLFGDLELDAVFTSTVGMEQAPSMIAGMLSSILPGQQFLVACEKFTVSRVTLATQQHQSLEVIGMLKYALADLHALPALHFQMPADAKGLFPNHKLTQLGMLTGAHKATSDHEKDALRHATLGVYRWAHGKAEVRKMAAVQPARTSEPAVLEPETV